MDDGRIKELVSRALDYWVKQRGCPRDKAILGVPFYGKAPATSYRDLIARDAGAAQMDNLGTIYFNGIPTMRKKTQLAYDQGGGIMIWEIGQDTRDQHSLLKAIADKAEGFPGAAVRRLPPSCRCRRTASASTPPPPAGIS